MLRILGAALAVSLLSIALTPVVRAQAGAGTSLSVSLPELVLLRYPSEITLAVVDGQAVGMEAASMERQASSGGVPVRVLLQGRSGDWPRVAAGLIEEAVSLQATTGSGHIRLSVTAAGEALHADGGRIGVSAALRGPDRTLTGAGGDLLLPSPGVVRTLLTDLEVELDLGEAREPGWYEGAQILVRAESF